MRASYSLSEKRRIRLEKVGPPASLPIPVSSLSKWPPGNLCPPEGSNNTQLCPTEFRRGSPLQGNFQKLQGFRWLQREFSLNFDHLNKKSAMKRFDISLSRRIRKRLRRYIAAGCGHRTGNSNGYARRAVSPKSNPRTSAMRHGYFYAAYRM